MLLFNWFGYRWVIGYLQQKTNSELEARLDENSYDESQLISVKVAVTHLSYFNTSADFERVNGSIEINGVQYKYVKRRLFNDSLELLCLPDQTAMKLRACKNDLFRVANGLQTDSGKRQGAHAVPVKPPMTDPYFVTDGFVPSPAFRWVSPVFVSYRAYFPSLFPSIDERPPDVVG